MVEYLGLRIFELSKENEALYGLSRAPPSRRLPSLYWGAH